MAVLTGIITRLGVAGSAEPAGRITLVDPADPDVIIAADIRCTTGPKMNIAVLAREQSQPVEIDVLNTAGTQANPFVADKIRLL